MKRPYKILVATMFYAVALIAVIYAVVSKLTVPIWAVLVFLGCTFILSVRADDAKTVRVKYFEPDLEHIEKISVGDWIDLRAAERVELKKGDYYLIRLGIGMILPEGYEAFVLPRSSTPAKFGIMCANSMGVIDNSYSGNADEWRFPALALRNTVIEKGDRIAQFRIMENQPKLTFTTVSSLKKKSRGGIGSTGRN